MKPNNFEKLIDEIPINDTAHNIFIDFMNKQLIHNFIQSLNRLHPILRNL